nr:hypothetical protein CFP56_24526 [Quercus suber]
MTKSLLCKCATPRAEFERPERSYNERAGCTQLEALYVVAPVQRLLDLSSAAAISSLCFAANRYVQSTVV